MSYFLPRIVGYSRAADLIFTSRAVDAQEAYRLGLLDRLIKHETLVEESVKLAKVSLEFADKNLDAANKKYELGTGLQLDVSNAQDRKVQAESTVVTNQIGERRTREITGGSPHLVYSLVQMDPPDHPKHRALTQAWFMPANLKKLEQRIRVIAAAGERDDAELHPRSPSSRTS